jgi:hypothetical protein
MHNRAAEMKNRLSVLCGLGLAAVLALSAVPDPASANDLRMYIENESSETLYFETQVGVEGYPDTIQPQTTSSDIRATHKGGGGDGQVTYTNNQNPMAASCKVTLGYGFRYDGVTDSCDDKKFSPVTTGACTLVQDGDCFGSGSCNCNFKFTVTAQ